MDRRHMIACGTVLGCCTVAFAFAPLLSVAQDKAKPIALSAVDLSKEVVANAKAAEQKYQGKMLVVEGVVYSANRVITDDNVVIYGFKKENELFGTDVHCLLKPDFKKKSYLLSKGQKLKVTGEFVGGVSRVILKDCTYVEISKSTVIEIAAKAVATAYVKDRAAAEKKYQGNELLLEGAVTKLEKSKDGFYSVILAGSGDFEVS